MTFGSTFHFFVELRKMISESQSGKKLVRLSAQLSGKVIWIIRTWLVKTASVSLRIISF